MSDKREDEDALRPLLPKATAEPLNEWSDPADGLNGEPELVAPDEYEALAEDVALAQQAVEEYETKGIEGTIPYSQYRSKRLGPAS